MSPELLGAIMLVVMLGAIFIGFPIAFTLMLLALIFGWVGLGDRAFYILVFQTIGLMQEEVLAAVPLFIFMGYLMEQGGLMERLFKGFQLMMGPVPGSLYVGVLITAAAAMGVVGAAFLAVVYREFTWQRLKDAVYNTLLQSSTVLFLAVAGNVFGAVFSRLGTATVATNALLGWQISPVAMLAVVMIVIFLLGWPFEWPAVILVFVPLMQPVIAAMKIDMLWFATLIAVNLQTAFLSPPVAMSAYYLKGVAPGWSLGDIYRGMGQFMVLQLIGLALCIIFPSIALWFPHWLFGK